MSVMLTEKAAKKVKDILASQNLPDTTMLRVGVTAGGCSGFSYSLNFEQNFDAEKDDLIDQFGIKVVIDKKSNLYIDGTYVDYYDGLEKQGFTFNNPNAVRTCGCGSSFQV
jgi:iron-sulfur cluster assembly protein